MEEKKRARQGCLWTVVILQSVALLVVLFIVAGVALIGMSFKRPTSSPRVGKDEYPVLKEVWSYGSGEVKVVRIPLRGMIFLGGENDLFPYMVSSSLMALKSIRRATHDLNVRAIIMEIDSGGGGITASDILYKALQNFKTASKGRKVMAMFGDTATSGAYYIAVASDYIVAHPTTITGSIGVLMQTLNVKELGEKIGIKDITIKSGEDKDILNPFGELTDRQRQKLQGVVDEFYNRFVSLVVENRQLSKQAVQKLKSGQIFTASEALQMGLIDQIGYWEDALAKVAQQLGVHDVKVYRYEEEFSFSGLWKAFQIWNPSAFLLRKASHTRLLYLWQL